MRSDFSFGDLDVHIRSQAFEATRTCTIKLLQDSENTIDSQERELDLHSFYEIYI